MTSFSIEGLNPQTELSKTTSCLEFLLVSFCKHFSLEPKQAAGLLTQGGKYLSYIVSKGFKGKHSLVIGWYQDVYTQVKHLSGLIEGEEHNDSVSLMLATLMPGLTSKNLETVIWCSRLMAKLAGEFIENDLLPTAWDWFVSETGGLECCLLAYKRFGSEIKSAVVSVMIQFAAHHFLELFSLQLRTAIPDFGDYLNVVNEFLPVLCSIRVAKQELISTGIIDYWIEISLRECEKGENKMSALNLLSDIWMTLPSIFEGNEDNFLSIFNRISRQVSRFAKIAYFGKLFQLLEVFVLDKNSYAPVIYKMITFSLVENNRDVLVREFIISNFTVIFSSFESIPIGILVGPMVKQLRLNNKIEKEDCELFMVASQHSSLVLKNAVQILDLLGEYYAKEESLYTSIPFIHICKRFIDSPLIEEFLLKFSQYIIKRGSNAMYFMVENILKIAKENLSNQIKHELFLLKSRTKNYDNLHVLNSLLGSYQEEITIEQPRSEKKLIEISSHSDKHILDKSNPRLRSLSRKDLNGIVDSRVILDIEKAKQNRIEREEREKKRIERETKKTMLRKRVLKTQVEQKKITTRSNTQISHVSRGEHYDYTEISPADKEFIDVLIKKYFKVFKMLFSKYSNTGYSSKDSRSLEKSETLTSSEFYKLLKEEAALVNLETASQIMRSYCHRHKIPNNRVSFKEFIGLMVHTSLVVFSRPPKDISHLPPVMLFQRLIISLRNHPGGLSFKFYDEPDPGLGDRDTVIKLNKQLSKKPDLELPEGYKKVQEKDIQVTYSLSENLNISENKKIVFEVLDEFLCSLFGFHLIQPTVSIVKIERIKGIAKPKTNISPTREENPKILNKALQRRQEEVRLKQEEDAEKEKKRKLRKQLVEEALNKAKVERQMKIDKQGQIKRADEESYVKRMNALEQRKKKQHETRLKQINEWKEEKMKKQEEKSEITDLENKKKEEARKKKQQEAKLREVKKWKEEKLKKQEENARIAEEEKKKAESLRKKQVKAFLEKKKHSSSRDVMKLPSINTPAKLPPIDKASLKSNSMKSFKRPPINNNN